MVISDFSIEKKLNNVKVQEKILNKYIEFVKEVIDYEKWFYSSLFLPASFAVLGLSISVIKTVTTEGTIKQRIFSWNFLILLILTVGAFKITTLLVKSARLARALHDHYLKLYNYRFAIILNGKLSKEEIHELAMEIKSTISYNKLDYKDKVRLSRLKKTRVDLMSQSGERDGYTTS